MAKCNFCGRGFPNSQAVRAHLKACAAYRERKPREFLPSEAPSEFPELSMADMLNQELEAEEVRLRLRGVQARHSELDAREQAGAARDRAEETAREAARLRRISERQRMQADLEIAERVNRARREAIQAAKNGALGGLGALLSVGLPQGTQELALVEIERELSGLAADELPAAELLRIAEAARDRVYGLTRQSMKNERIAQERRGMLIEAGVRYGMRELDEMGIGVFERIALSSRLRGELGTELAGSETESEVFALVENFLGEVEENDS